MSDLVTPHPHVPSLLGAEVERAAFTGGAVVHVVGGDPSDPEASVIDVCGATVVVTSERVVAADGDLEWEWYLEDVEDTVHGRSAPWTILAVPGVPDTGVAVAPADVEAFRDVLARARAEAGRPPTAWEIESGATEEPPEPALDAEATRGADPAVEDKVEAFAPPGAEPGPDEDEDEDEDEGRPLEAGAGAPDGVTEAGVLVDDPMVAAGTMLVDDPMLDGSRDDTIELDLDDLHQAALEAEDAPMVPVVSRRARLRSRVRPGPRRRSGTSTVDPPAALAALEAREISAWFGEHHVLDRVSLTMPAGQVTALIGPSGCGKSTFLRILNRMHEMIPSASLSGSVLLDGEDVYDVDKKLADARRHIGMVFQKPNPFPAMSIYDNVVASFRLTGLKVSNEVKDEVVESCLTKAGLWTEVRDRLRMPGGGLSGGQQQRLCIARALAIRPRVLLMDEPCSALDPTSTRRIEQTITELGSEVTIVIVTHNMQQAARVSDRCAFFLAEQGTPGVIVEHGPTDLMFASPQDERTHDYVNGRFG